MAKGLLVLLIALPLFNFLHESGHWLGAKLIGGEPKMLLQRVDIGDEAQFSAFQIAVYNWGGPAVNYSAAGVAFFFSPLAPIGFLAVAHRLAPQLFAIGMYSIGKTSFSTDETKRFPESERFIAAIAFSVIYGFGALVFLRRWKPSISPMETLTTVLLSSIVLLAYGILLDILDKKA